MFKNVASQKIALFVYDSTTGAPKTGDGANLTPYVSKDYGTVTVLGTTTATEMDATNAKGWYSFVLTQGETNADALLFSGKSSTANAFVVGSLIYTDPPNYSSFSVDSNGRVDVIKLAGTTNTARDIGASVLLSTGSGTGQLDFTSGVVKANATQWLGGTIPAVNVTGVPLVDLKYTLGTISPATAGSVRADAVTGAVGSVTGAVGSVTGAVGSVTGNVGGNVTGTVGSVVGAVGSVTGAVGSVTGNVGGNVTGSVGSVVGDTPQTGDSFARIGATGSGLTTITGRLPAALTGAGNMKVDVLALNGDTTSAGNIQQSTAGIVTCVVSSGASATSFVAVPTPIATVNDQFKGRIITFAYNTTTAALRGQSTDITAYTQASNTFTVTALTSTPANGDTFVIT